MKKLLIISIIVILAAVNVVVVADRFEVSNVSLNSILNVAMANVELEEPEPPSTTEPRDSTKVGYWKYDNVLKENICTPTGTAC